MRTPTTWPGHRWPWAWAEEASNCSKSLHGVLSYDGLTPSSVSPDFDRIPHYHRVVSTKPVFFKTGSTRMAALACTPVARRVSAANVTPSMTTSPARSPVAMAVGEGHHTRSNALSNATWPIIDFIRHVRDSKRLPHGCGNHFDLVPVLQAKAVGVRLRNFDEIFWIQRLEPVVAPVRLLVWVMDLVWCDERHVVAEGLVLNRDYRCNHTDPR